MRLPLFVCLLLLHLCLVNALFATTQSVAARGTLRCGNTPAANVRVKLVDEDDGPNPDDELDAGYTDENGNFHLSGETSEWSNIDPRVKIYHDCLDHGRACQKKWKIEIPDKYITRGSTPKSTFILGHVNLEVDIEGQERDSRPCTIQTFAIFQQL